MVSYQIAYVHFSRLNLFRCYYSWTAKAVWKTLLLINAVLLQDVIDGDLCEQYPSLPADMQRKIADELDRTPGEILKKLEDIRNKII